MGEKHHPLIDKFILFLNEFKKKSIIIIITIAIKHCWEYIALPLFSLCSLLQPHLTAHPRLTTSLVENYVVGFFREKKTLNSLHVYMNRCRARLSICIFLSFIL